MIPIMYNWMKLNKKTKPENNEVILFKTKKKQRIPELGIYEEFESNAEVYVIANDDVEQTKNIAKWCRIPIDFDIS